MLFVSLSDHYDMYFSPNPIIRHFHQDRLHSILRHVPPASGSRVLDVGCGLGILLEHLSGERHGVDYDLSVVQVAQQRLGEKASIVCADASVLPYPDAHFEVVICSEMLEHLSDPLPVIREMLRVAKPSGRIIITVPNEFWLTFGRFVMLKSPAKVADHVQDFQVADLERLFGRRAKKVEFIGGPLESVCVFKLAVFEK